MGTKQGSTAIIVFAIFAAAASPTAFAQAQKQAPPAVAKKVIMSQDDLPRFTYPVSGSASDLLKADDATFNAFAKKVGANIDKVLANYEITDHATLRRLLGTKGNIELLEGKYNAALRTFAQVRALQDKPDAKLVSGLYQHAYVVAARATGTTSGKAFEQAFGKNYAAKINALPWLVVGNTIKSTKSSSEMLTPALAMGSIAADLDPAVTKTGSLSGDFAAALIDARTTLKVFIPHLATVRKVLTSYVAANDVKKPDIWTARDVTFTAGDKLTPVRVTIWDSGTDLSLFPGRVYTDPHPTATTDPHGIAFDLDSNPSHGDLMPLTPAQQAAYPGVRADIKGLSDQRLSIDSPQAAALRKKITSLKPDQVAPFLQELNLFSFYSHGTHVAGIAARGNPAIRLSYARITFDWKTIPQKPTEERALKDAAATRTYVDWMKRNKIRVVNMSWGGSPAGLEAALEKNGVGATSADRKVLAKKLFDIRREALFKAIKDAPNILFVCAAGNSDSSAGFDEFMPASFDLPNLLVVGAVDQAGEEAPFTSYGKTVKVDANGYQVQSYYPGGAKIRESGTSMASPAVANLAAKLIALDPSLTPEKTIQLIVRGSTPSKDERRNNINPKASVALLNAWMEE